MKTAKYREQVRAVKKIDPYQKAIDDVDRIIASRLSIHSLEERDQIADPVLEIHFVGVERAVQRGDLSRLEELAARFDHDLHIAGQHFDQTVAEAERVAAERLRSEFAALIWRPFERDCVIGSLKLGEKIEKVELRQVITNQRTIRRGDETFDALRPVSMSKAFFYSQMTPESALQEFEDNEQAKRRYIADAPIGGRHMPVQEY